jgi:hypothetical protein
MVDNLAAGLFSGVVVSIFVLVFSKFWKAILVPWFEDIVYKDARIEGRWYSLYLNTKELRSESISLNRSGHKVSGTMTCINGDDCGESYEFFGSFRNMILPLCYETKNKSKTDRGTIALKCVSNGQKFVGNAACYLDRKDRIDTIDVMWFRDVVELQSYTEKIKQQRAMILELEKKKEKISKEIFALEKPKSAAKSDEKCPMCGELSEGNEDTPEEASSAESIVEKLPNATVDQK